MVGRTTSLRARSALVGLVVGFGFLDLVAAAPESPLIPALPSGVGPPGWSTRAAEWLRLDRLTRTPLTVVSIVVLALLVTALGVVLVEALQGRVRLGPVLAAGGASLALAVLAPVLLSRDVYSYAAYGRIFALHGANPYVQPPSMFPSDPFVAVASREWINTPSVYGPVYTLISAGIARAWSGSPAATILAFKVMAAASVGVAALLASVVVRVVRPGRETAAAAAVVLNPVVIVHTVGGGHNDALLSLCFAVALALAVRSRGWDGEDSRAARTMGAAALGATAVLTVAVLIKSVALPLLVLWLWHVTRRARPEHRTRTLGAHLGVAVVLGAAAFVPLAAGARTARALISVVSRQGWASGPGLIARGARALGRAAAGTSMGLALETLVSVLFALVFIAVFWRILRRSEGFDQGDAWGRSMLLLALTAPYLLPWYAAWFLPFAALLENAALSVVAFAAAGLLALTGVPAEPGSAPGVWQAMMLGVHYGAAPIMLAMLAVAVRRG